MKKIITVFMLALILVGCGSKETPSSELYQEVVALYEKFITDEESVDLSDINGMASLARQDFYEGVFYNIMDIDSNGTDELLVSIKGIDGKYRLLDVRTIKDNVVKSLTHDNEVLKFIGERMILSVLDNGQLLYPTMSENGEKVNKLFEINEEGQLVELTEEIQIDNKVTLEDLEWTLIGEEKEIPLIYYFEHGFYDVLNGKWQNGKGETIEIIDDKIHFDYGAIAEIINPVTIDNESFSMSALFDDLFGSGMAYYTAEYSDDYDFIVGDVLDNVEKIYISQAEVYAEDVFYRVED